MTCAQLLVHYSEISAFIDLVGIKNVLQDTKAFHQCIHFIHNIFHFLPPNFSLNERYLVQNKSDVGRQRMKQPCN